MVHLDGGIIENSKYSTLPVGRIFTGVTCVLVFLLALLLIVVVAPTQNRSGNSTRVCTLLHCGLALLSSCLGLVAAVLNVLPAAFVDASLSAIIAVSMAIDGHLTWQRYLIVHNHNHPSKAQTFLVYTFILLCFSLPFVFMAVLWGFEEAADVGKISDRDPGKQPLMYGGLVLYVLSIPCRICWDTSLGCAVITRMHELRLSLAIAIEGGGEGRDQEQIEQQHQTLLLVARKTIFYICISTSLNLFIHLPLTRVIPFIAAVTTTYNLTFALASHYCFNTRAGSSDVFLLFWPFALLSHAAWRAWKWLQRRLLSSSKAQEEVEEQQQEGGRPRWWRRSFSLKGGASSRHRRDGCSESKLRTLSKKTYLNNGANREKDGGKGCDLSSLRIVVDSQLPRMSEDTSEERDAFSGDGLTTRDLGEEEEEEELLFDDEKVVKNLRGEGEEAKEKEALETLREEEKGQRRSGTSSSFLRRRETIIGSSKAFSGRSSSSSASLHTNESGFDVGDESQEEGIEKEEEEQEEGDGEEEEEEEEQEEDGEEEEKEEEQQQEQQQEGVNDDEDKGDGENERRVDRRLRGRQKRRNGDDDQALCKVVVVSHGNQ